MEITLDELQEIFSQLMQKIKDKGIESVKLEVDYYWHIPVGELFDPYHKPQDLDLGQITDDWIELRKILQNKKKPIGYHLVWLAAILRAVGENVIL